MSYSVQMWGWFSDEIALASRSRRWRTPGVSANRCGKTFKATVRWRRLSLARYTSPMPPAPKRASITYGPSSSPGANRYSLRLCCEANIPAACPMTGSSRKQALDWFAASSDSPRAEDLHRPCRLQPGRLFAAPARAPEPSGKALQSGGNVPGSPTPPDDLLNDTLSFTDRQPPPERPG